MTAMFPASGVPAADAKNSIADPATVNCEELWYSTSRCQPRFDAAAANAMLAEMINAINRGEVTYDCNVLDNLQLSIRRMIQRGIPQFGITYGNAPNYYELALDPFATRYNNGMVPCVVPHVTNLAACGINVSGLGYVPILRNDASQLFPGDFRAGAPVTICYYNGYFWLQGTGIAYSNIPVVGKLPQVLTADLDTWVRTDGNDDTGDGTANHPDRAFRTINGCWRKIGGLFIASPIYAINIRLGIPGDYEGCDISSYGGRVRVIGDETSNKVGYRIISTQNANPAAGNPYSICVTANAMNDLNFRGVTFVMTGYPEGTGVAPIGLSIGDGNCAFINCDFSFECDNTASTAVWSKGSAASTGIFGTNHVFGNGNRVSHAVFCMGGGFATLSGQASSFNFHNLRFNSQAFLVSSIARCSIPGCTITQNDCTGVRYLVQTNSVLESNGQTLPGDQPGSVASGGIYL